MYVIETYNLTKEFRIERYRKFYTSDLSSSPSVFFQTLIGRLTKRVISLTTKALDSVNIKVKENEVFGVLGPNGAGKSTLLKILAGLTFPTSGKVSVLGYDVIRDNNEVIRRVNFVPNLVTGGVWCNPLLSARKNLTIIAELFNISKEKVDEVLKFVGLHEVADRIIGTFSTGMIARLIVASGLLREAPIYLMDEPTLGLSAEAVREFHALIKEYIKKDLKATIVYATNNVLEAQKLCDRVAILSKGKVLACGRPTDLIKMLGKCDIVEIKTLGEVDRKIVNEIRALDGVINILTKDSKSDVLTPSKILRIHVHEVEDILSKIINLLVKKHDIKIRRIEIIEPTLEDVFIHLTKRGGEKFFE